jgi:hypothetical protein
MFGNRLGWGISAVLAAVIGLLLWLTVNLNTVSDPSIGVVARTGNVSLNLLSHPEILDPIQLPFNPQAILPSMTDAQDAALLYRKAIDECKSDVYTYRDIYQDKTKKPKSDNYKDLPAIVFIVDARNCTTMNLFTANPEEVIDYGKEAQAPIDLLYFVGEAASRIALRLPDDRRDEAMILAESVFSLGVKMCTERLRWQEFTLGADLVREGAYMINKLDKDKTRSAAATVDAGMKKLLKERCIPLATVITSVDQDVIGRTAGDNFYIAKNSKERLWRIEAILKLGRYKFNVGNEGRGADQRWAALTVKRMAANPSLDPATRAAAKAANNLTFPRYNMIGG